MEQALLNLRKAERAFEAALASHDAQARTGGEGSEFASAQIAQAALSLRRALLDPMLPPP